MTDRTAALRPSAGGVASAGGVQIRLLGPLAVIDADGTDRDVSGTRQRLLLARLALSPGTAVSVNALFDLLWPDEPPDNAMGNLQSYVSRLRRMIDAEVVQRSPSGYRLDIAPEQVDVGRLDRLVTTLRGTPAHDLLTRARLADEALALWRGEPLAEFAGFPVFDAERVRLDELHLQLREDSLESRTQLEPARDVLPELEQAVAEQPARERLAMLLMRALHRDGRTADALRVAAEHRQRAVEHTGLDPSPALAELEQQLLADDPELRPDTPAAGAGNALAARRPLRHTPVDTFVGRRDELDEVVAHLGRQRLVTVVGPGGVGKSRLVFELIDHHTGEIDDPFVDVHVVELAQLLGSNEVEPAVVDAVGLAAAPGGHLAAIADALADRRCLLVIDNCEHLLDGVHQLVTQLIARCPNLVVLATSRRPLGISGEQVVRLGALDADDQVELFCDRAARARAGFRPGASDRQLIADICARVEGLPLAVELAARRESVFGLRQLRVRLLEDLGLLDLAGDDGRGVRATIEWSRELLDPRARSLFDRLAVCRDGFGLEAVEHLAPAGVDGTVALAQLVDASLVTADVEADPPRYRLLEVTRQVGLSHLSADELVEARRAHARWAAGVADELRVSFAERALGASDLLRREGSNLQAALTWTLADGDLAAAAEIGIALTMAAVEVPHLPLLETLCGVGAVLPTSGGQGHDRTNALLHLVAGGAEWLGGNWAMAEPLLGTALEHVPADDAHRSTALYFHTLSKMFGGDVEAVEVDVAELLGAPAPSWMRVEAVCLAAMSNLFAGRRERARSWMAEHADELEVLGDRDGIIEYTLGEITAEDDPEAALAHFARAMQLCDERGLTFNREVASLGHAAVVTRLGRHADAARECAGLLARLPALGMWPQVWTTVRLVAELLVSVGEALTAAELLAAADADPLAPPVYGPDRDRVAELWGAIEASCDAAEVARARRAGEHGGRVRAVEHARAALSRAASARAG